MQQNIAHDLDDKERTKDVLLEENVNFTSLLLKSDIQNGLKDSGYKKPSPIQFKAIPLGRCGFDLIVKSKSGTGKTLVFSTIALETVNVEKVQPQVLILVPTREIAVQIQDVLRNIGRHINGLCIEFFIGGTPLERDIEKAKYCHVAVGAPGRVKHLINLKALSVKSVRLFVLDEADKLMEETFQSDINEIYDVLPQRKQLIATSATYPKELDAFLANYMLSPTHVTSENETPLLLGLRQFVAVINCINTVQQMKAKNDLLLDIFSKISFRQCLVFTNYQSRTESVCNFLNQKGWTSDFISAAVKQKERLEAINNLKNFKSRILLSTDLTSRGIDAPNVDLVINYDLPIDAVTYLHRMGRAGRYGSQGIIINFASEGAEVKKLQSILGTIGATNLSVSKLPPLTGTDLWLVDPGDLEQIWGVVGEETPEVSEDIKKEVMTLKQRKDRGEKRKNKQKKIKLEELSISDKVEDLLKVKEEEVEKSLQIDLDSEDLLSSLINNDDEDRKKRKREVKLEDTTSVVYDIVKSETKIENLDITSDDDSKKRKLNQSQLQSHEKTHNWTFSKNKALLSITKLLYDPSTHIDGDMVQSIADYLTILKEQHLNDNHRSVEEILKIEETSNEDALENIFKVGYECAVKNENLKWSTYLPNQEINRFQEFCREEEIIISSESEEENEDFEMIQDGEEDQIAEATNDVDLQWVPVVPETANDHYNRCYEDCSSVLWQNGLSFDNVADFDIWFYHWQEQLQSVRNYVQQNIYVEEMSKYQQSRLSNK